jgi:uncharacterized protein YkwD
MELWERGLGRLAFSAGALLVLAVTAGCGQEELKSDGASRERVLSGAEAGAEKDASTGDDGTVSGSTSGRGAGDDGAGGKSSPPQGGAQGNTQIPTPGSYQGGNLPSSQGDEIKDYARKVFELSNQERATAGLKSFSQDALLTSAALAHAEDMARQGYFSHTGLDGSTPFERIKATGYLGRAMGENIAFGQPTAETVMTSWMNSPGHKGNILSAQFGDLGVGVARNDAGQLMWVQTFGRK